MVTSAGLVVIYDKKILLVQQSNDPKKERLSIPKGRVEPGENLIDAAIRETFEETGILVPLAQIDATPYLMNVNSRAIKRRLIYFIARLDGEPSYTLPRDIEEVKWAGFLGYSDAMSRLQITQQSVLMHLNTERMPSRLIRWLLKYDYITQERHPVEDIYIYNYTDRCKEEEFWNEATLWCRGLILDKEFKIVAYPLKKFFEFHHLYPEFVNTEDTFDVFEKKDGALGILYWVNDMPFISTRASFVSAPSHFANILLYSKYIEVLGKLDKRFSYHFEIVYPGFVNIIDYGDTEEIFLIGAYDNYEKKDVPLSTLNILPFPKVKQLKSIISVESLLKDDIEGEEGYVIKYLDGSRVKIKFPNYKKKYAEKYSTKD